MEGRRDRRLRVLYMIDFLHGYSGGGTERHLASLVKHLDRSRFEPHILAFDMGESDLIRGIREAGVPLIHHPVRRYYGPVAFARALQLARLVRRLQVDIVQTFHFKADTYGAFVARLAGVKCIVSSKRDVGDRKKRIHLWLHRRMKGCFSGFIAVADAVGESVVRKEGVPRDRIRVIYNGVDVERYRPADPEQKRRNRARLGLRDEDFVVGTVAVLRKEKNHDVLLRAAKVLCPEIPALRFVCVGGGALGDAYRRTCVRNGLAERVLFTGAADDVLPYLTTFDAGCLVPGSNEGFSNAVLEKMAMGLPLVVSDVGGNREAVVDGWNGFVIPPFDEEALVRSVRQLYSDEAARREMGRRSRERAEKTFSLETMIRRHEAYYEEQIAAVRGRGR